MYFYFFICSRKLNVIYSEFRKSRRSASKVTERGLLFYYKRKDMNVTGIRSIDKFNIMKYKNEKYVSFLLFWAPYHLVWFFWNVVRINLILDIFFIKMWILYFKCFRIHCFTVIQRIWYNVFSWTHFVRRNMRFLEIQPYRSNTVLSLCCKLMRQTFIIIFLKRDIPFCNGTTLHWYFYNR